MNRGEDIVQALLVKLEVLVTWAGKEPRDMGTGVAAETGRRTRLGAGAAAELPPLLEEAHRIAVFSHIIGGYQSLVSPSNYYNIETCVSQLNLLMDELSAISFQQSAISSWARRPRPYNLHFAICTFYFEFAGTP
jgi:hypothetical protein